MRSTRLVTINYTGLLTDVGVNPASVAGATPTSIDRSVDGKTVGWDYTTSPGVTPGGNSVLLVLHTNALQFQNVTNSVINGSFATVPASARRFPSQPPLAWRPSRSWAWLPVAARTDPFDRTQHEFEEPRIIRARFFVFRYTSHRSTHRSHIAYRSSQAPASSKL